MILTEVANLGFRGRTAGSVVVMRCDGLMGYLSWKA